MRASPRLLPAGSTPQVVRLAADWAAQAGTPSAAQVSADTSVTWRARSRSTAASAAVMGSSAWNTTWPSAPRLPCTRPAFRAEAAYALAQVGMASSSAKPVRSTPARASTPAASMAMATNSPRVTAASGWKK